MYSIDICLVLKGIHTVIQANINKITDMASIFLEKSIFWIYLLSRFRYILWSHLPGDIDVQTGDKVVTSLGCWRSQVCADTHVRLPMSASQWPLKETPHSRLFFSRFYRTHPWVEVSSDGLTREDRYPGFMTGAGWHQFINQSRTKVKKSHNCFFFCKSRGGFCCHP